MKGHNHLFNLFIGILYFFPEIHKGRLFWLDPDYVWTFRLIIWLRIKEFSQKKVKVVAHLHWVGFAVRTSVIANAVVPQSCHLYRFIIFRKFFCFAFYPAVWHNFPKKFFLGLYAKSANYSTQINDLNKSIRSIWLEGLMELCTSVYVLELLVLAWSSFSKMLFLWKIWLYCNVKFSFEL